MRDLAPVDRPREKLTRWGVETLGENELLAIVIGHGTAACGALEMANRLLAATDGATGLTRRTPDDVRAIVPGVGPVLAARILAAVELGRRSLVRSPELRPQFVTPRDIAAYLLPQFGAYPVERCGVVLMDARQRLIRVRLLTVGSVDASVMNPREVFREALVAGASGVAVFHNHPSGDPTPSRDDHAMTKRLVRAAEIMGVSFMDHVILADARYFSFQEYERSRQRDDEEAL